MIDYKKAGVDIDRSDRFVKDIRGMAAATRRSEIINGIGGFSALAKIPKKYRIPILVSSTDGVGTKLMIADLLNEHSTIGVDLVAMCVNDIVLTGAEPLFFLDYLATGRMNNKKALDILKGIVRGCSEAGCSLIGGETAEMPGMYAGDKYDLAGFCVGVVEKSKIIDGHSVRPGDRIVGIRSSGLHSNGFSLVRKVFKKSELKTAFGKILLRPTVIYVRAVQRLVKRVKVRAMAHITGGGFYDNIPRVLPKGLSPLIYKGLWQVPDIFREIQKRAGLGDREMYRTFNMGIGMVLVVGRKEVDKTHKIIKISGLKSWTIGEIIKGRRGVVL